MKLRLLTFIAIFIIMAQIDNQANAVKPDFRFPKDVSTQALSDIKKFQGTNDKQRLIEALLRYHKAETSISPENSLHCIETIDSFAQKEQQPEYQALFYLILAKLKFEYTPNSRPYQQPLSKDSSLLREIWDLCDKAEAHIPQIRNDKLSKYDLIIENTTNDIGVNTLADFIYYSIYKLNEVCPRHITNDFFDRWLKSISPDNTHLMVYVELHKWNDNGDRQNFFDVYQKYQHSEECYPILERMTFENNVSEYKHYTDYVKRFPKSRFVKYAKSHIGQLAHKSISFTTNAQGTNKIDYTVHSENVNQFTFSLYPIIGAIKPKIENLIKMKPAYSMTHNLEGTVPFNVEKSFVSTDLPYGKYAAIISFVKNGKTVYPENYNIINHTSVGAIVYDNPIDSTISVIAVDNYSGRPLSGVNVETVSYSSIREEDKMDKKDKKKLGITNEQGVVTTSIAQHNQAFILTKDKNDIAQIVPFYFYYFGYHNHKEPKQFYVLTQTDLAIYRPGETVKFSAVIHSVSTRSRKLIAGAEIKVTLRDTNYKDVESKSFVTDDYGRISGEFIIPKDRMNGSWHLLLEGKNINEHKNITVDEYKSPSFSVELTTKPTKFSTTENIVFAGKVMSFSGMPVANSEVKVSIRHNNNSEVIFNDTITTNQDGEFSITKEPIPESKRENGTWRYYHNYNFYSIEFACTNATGETQSASHMFFVGKANAIKVLNSSVTHINDKPLKLPIALDSELDTTNYACRYELCRVDDDKIVQAGEFFIQDPTVNFTECASGQYIFKVRLANSTNDDDFSEIDLVLFKETDKECPVKTALWVPDCAKKIDNDNVAHFAIGTSVEKSYVFFIAHSKYSFLQSGWIELAKGLHHLSMPMPSDGSDMTVKFRCINNHNFESASLSFAGEKAKQHLKLEAVSFRNKLTSGTKETWSFRLLDQEGNPVKGAAMLELFDKAINSIMPNTWRARFREPFGYRLFINESKGWDSASGHAYAKSNRVKDYEWSKSPHYIYNQHFFDRIYHAYADYKYADNVSFSIRAKIAPKMEIGATNALYSDNIEIETEEEKESELNKIAMRTHDIKTALWLPDITTGDDGTFSITFDVPLFNTSWILQAIAYNQEMLAGNLREEVESSMPIMVKANMPRFVRVGDKVSLAAMVSNKLSKATSFNGIIELFDPRTDVVLAKKSISGKLDAMGSKAVSIDFAVPTDVLFLGFRIKAMAEGSGDGEQVMIPVLSDASPVIEASNFFINSEEKTASINLPKPHNAQVTTFEYCDNPTWYCVTALPSITTEGEAITVTTLAHDIFATYVAVGLARDIPAIPSIIKLWKAQNDSCIALASNLTKNRDLKIGSLIASPWLRESERQALRMSSLDKLFNSAHNAELTKKLIARLKKFQNADGGFMWLTHSSSRSSEYCTGVVLELLGEIKQLGYLPNDSTLQKIISRAINYLDSELLATYEKEVKHHHKSFSNHLDYAYLRSLFSEIPLPDKNRSLLNRIISDIAKDWGDFDISQKGFATLTMLNNGNIEEAKLIAKSIRQFAITDSRGMHWDCISRNCNWWGYRNELAVTSTLLQALNAAGGEADEIDQIRKWILLQKQSNDWGNSSLAADAVYALLTTGTGWLEFGSMPELLLDGKPVELTASESILGYVRKQIELPNKASTLSITRHSSNNPAWGSIFSQYTDKLSAIKAAKTDELSIEKEIYLVGGNGSLSKATNLKVGDKVRVQFTIKANKDVSFVTLNDQRGACFEPADKLSGYEYDNWSWYYKEIKDSETNMFFNFIERGTHVVSYDVYVTNPGEFSIGIATLQSQYDASHVAHTAGGNVTVE